MFAYDAAGQLQTITGADGSRVEFVHDGLGRRTRLIGEDGSWTEYAWGPTGHLTGTCNRTPDGDVTSRHELWVDALGELAGIDGTHLWWDTANPIPTLTPAATTGGITSGIAGGGACNGGQVLSLPGGVTGIGDAWTAPGWRAARPTDETDPWAVLGTPTIPTPGGMTGAGTAQLGAGAGAGAVSGLTGGLPPGVSLTGHDSVDIAGLEWLGARAYDPGTRGFLSTDPLAPVLGAGWDGNPYAYAGNNPLNTTDPTGLRPLTDDELKAYDGTAGGAIAAAGDWLGNNWEYVVGGAAIVGGAALMFVPGGQVVGAGLISFGADVVIQKATTGDVNWGQAAIFGGLGMVGGGVGMAAGRMVSNPVARAAVQNGVEGAISGAGAYYTGPGPHTPAGALRASTIGAGTGLAPIPTSVSKVDRLGDLPTTPLTPQRLTGAALVAKGAHRN